MILRFIVCVLLKRRHDAVKQLIGGYRCRDCGTAGADLAAMGCLDRTAYVSPVRKVFNREYHEVTRTSAWEPTKRGW